MRSILGFTLLAVAVGLGAIVLVGACGSSESVHEISETTDQKEEITYYWYVSRPDASRNVALHCVTGDGVEVFARANVRRYLPDFSRGTLTFLDSRESNNVKFYKVDANGKNLELLADLTEVAPKHSALHAWHYNPDVGLLAAELSASGGSFIIVYDVVAQAVLYNENFSLLFNAQVWNNFSSIMPTHYGIYVNSEFEIIVTEASERRTDNSVGDHFPLYVELDWRTETLSVLDDARGIPFVRIADGMVYLRDVSMWMELFVYSEKKGEWIEVSAENWWQIQVDSESIHLLSHPGAVLDGSSERHLEWPADIVQNAKRHSLMASFKSVD